MQKRIIRVMIVEDSRLYQTYLRKVIEQDSYLAVAGIASTGKEARSLVETTKPDVITLDLHLEDVAKFELLRYLLRDYNDIPIIVVSSLPKACEEALQLGAHDFIQKITDDNRFSAKHFAQLLQLKIKMQVSQFRQRQVDHGTSSRRESADPLRQPAPAGGKQTDLIAIGASVGGTESTLEVLQKLPVDTPPILIVQHMPVGFTKAYAMRLDQNCSLQVSEASDGDRLRRGMALVAQSGYQMKVLQDRKGYYVRIFSGEKVSGFCPSVDVLFASVAETGGSGIGIIMTGMGHDGVAGIKKMHQNGFYTIGQEKESCVVYGMPQKADQAQALDELLSPQKIAERIIERCKHS